jgi:hypothetical protein
LKKKTKSREGDEGSGGHRVAFRAADRFRLAGGEEAMTYGRDGDPNPAAPAECEPVSWRAAGRDGRSSDTG